jgi:hypothetical protein
MEYPSDELGEMRDSNALLGDPAALRERMQEDGYLLMRGLIDRDKVLAAREEILQYMAEREGLEPGSRPLDGVMGEYGKGVPMLGKKAITHNDAVRDVLEGEELFSFFERYFDAKPRTFDYKWLRAVGNERFTGCHYDVVYMGRGSDRVHTTWIPFGDISVEQGTLAVCAGSNSDPGFARLRETYGRHDVDRDRGAGWFSTDPREITEKFGGRWLTTDFRAGDMITFGLYLMHASTTNVTDRWRLSCDVRFQPADEPVDSRWVGDDPGAHEAAAAGKNTVERPIEEFRAEWGV